MTMPDWLDRAVSDASDLTYPHATSDLTDVRPGDLWTIVSDRGNGPQRIVLVLNAEGAHLDVALTTNDIDYATDRDILLEPNDTGVPYRLIVETPLTGRVSWTQVRRRVGLVADDLLDDILDFVWEERPARLNPRRGHPLQRPLSIDRLEFERDEAQSLSELTRKTNSELVAVDCAQVRATLTVADCIRQFELLADESIVVCHGLVDAISNSCADGTPPSPSEIDELIGSDIVNWRLQQLYANRLMCGEPVVAALRLIDGSTYEVACGAQPGATNHDRIALRSGATIDGPVGYLNEIPVFAMEQSDG